MRLLQLQIRGTVLKTLDSSSVLLGKDDWLFYKSTLADYTGLFYGSIDTDVLDAGVKYLQIIALSYPFLALYNGGAALFRSIGNSKISMQISFLMNIINIVGNAVCIFGFKMGVDGVAWPSVVSRVVAAALILRKCYRSRPTTPTTPTWTRPVLMISTWRC